MSALENFSRQNFPQQKFGKESLGYAHAKQGINLNTRK